MKLPIKITNTKYYHVSLQKRDQRRWSGRLNLWVTLILNAVSQKPQLSSYFHVQEWKEEKKA